MNSYPHDEFDDVPENSARRGAYRGQPAASGSSSFGFISILLAGFLALVLGAFMFIYQPRTLGPRIASSLGVGSSASASASPSASSSATATASPSSQASQSVSQLKVEIYDGGAYPGAADEVEQAMLEQGYKVNPAASWQGEPLASSVVFYAQGFVDEANSLADSLGIPLIEVADSSEPDLYLVLAPDYAGPVPAAGAGQTTTVDPGALESSYADPNQVPVQ